MAHLQTMFQRPDRITTPLYVVVPLYNASRYRSRWRLYEDFARQCEHSGAILYTVEVAFGERAFAVTTADNPRHLQLRSNHHLWLKERAINLGVARLPADWRYVAWVDPDSLFVRPDWADETIHQLQHYPLVQMWSQYQNLTAGYELLGTAQSFVDGWLNGRVTKQGAYDHARYPGAPGLAWAATREAWDTLGGLLDVCVIGAGDWYMAHSVVGAIDQVIRRAYTTGYQAAIQRWADRAAALKQNVGMVDGLALHYWHGPKALRRYKTRDQILIDHQFDPHVDLCPDWQGVWQWTDRVPALRHAVRRYFAERDEDA